jgi:hypothetical protein
VEARASYERALGLARQEPERRFLERRLGELPDRDVERYIPGFTLLTARSSAREMGRKMWLAGTSGNSSRPHLHDEIIVKGEPVGRPAPSVLLIGPLGDGNHSRGHGLSVDHARGGPPMKALTITLVILLALTAVPALAAGPFDGIWIFQQIEPDGGFQTTLLASIHQSDAFLPQGFNTLVVVLDLDGFWNYNVGILSGNVLSGTIFDLFGGPFGSFTFTFTSPTALSGTGFLDDFPVLFSGEKLF